MQGMGRKIWGKYGLCLAFWGAFVGVDGILEEVLEALTGDREGRREAWKCCGDSCEGGSETLRRGCGGTTEALYYYFWSFFGFFNCAVFVGFLVFS